MAHGAGVTLDDAPLYEGDPGIGVRRPINAVPILKFISFLGACV